MLSFIIIPVTCLGLFFMLTGAIGAIRLPDFYTRTHAVSVTDTLGALLVLLGLAVHHGLDLVSVKIAFLFLFISLANPTVTHVLIRAAYRSGVKVWQPSEAKGRSK